MRPKNEFCRKFIYKNDCYGILLSKNWVLNFLLHLLDFFPDFWILGENRAEERDTQLFPKIWIFFVIVQIPENENSRGNSIVEHSALLLLIILDGKWVWLKVVLDPVKGCRHQSSVVGDG